MVDCTQFRLMRSVPIMALLLRNSCLYCYLPSAIPSCYAVEQKHEIASVVALKFCPIMGLVMFGKTPSGEARPAFAGCWFVIWI
jgi:hypothetical protein